MDGCHSLEPIILCFLSSPCETWQCRSTVVGRGWGGPCANFCSFCTESGYCTMLDCGPLGCKTWHATWWGCYVNWRDLWAQAQGSEGSERGRDVFSNKIISIYELKLGSSLSICRAGSFSFPPALLGGAKAYRQSITVPGFSSCTYSFLGFSEHLRKR